jgi:hypothetical protein
VAVAALFVVAWKRGKTAEDVTPIGERPGRKRRVARKFKQERHQERATVRPRPTTDARQSK